MNKEILEEIKRAAKIELVLELQLEALENDYDTSHSYSGMLTNKLEFLESAQYQHEANLDHASEGQFNEQV